MSVAKSGAQANQINDTESSTLTASIGGTAFTNAALVITTVADTANVFGTADTHYGNIGISTIHIAGIGTATFTGGDYGFFSYSLGPGVNTIGFINWTTSAGVLANLDPIATKVYDLSTPHTRRAVEA